MTFRAEDLFAERRRLRKLFWPPKRTKRPPPTPPPPSPPLVFPPLPQRNIKPLEERVAEADAISRELSWDTRRKIRNAILNSARDCGERLEGELAPPRVAIAGHPTVAEIQKFVASYFGITHAAILSRHKYREIITPRQIAMYLSRQLTPRSNGEIGQRFSRNHSTVYHAGWKIAALIKKDSDLAADIAALKRMLTE